MIKRRDYSWCRCCVRRWCTSTYATMMYTSVRESCHVRPSRRLILEAINVGGDSAERPRCSPILPCRPSLLPARLLLARSYSIVALVTFNRFDRIEQHVYTGLAFNLAPCSRTVYSFVPDYQYTRTRARRIHLVHSRASSLSLFLTNRSNLLESILPHAQGSNLFFPFSVHRKIEK